MLLAGIASALWFGILTSISPCPLATNIVAISFIGKRLSQTGHVLLTGLAYTVGRMITYVVIGIIIVAGLLSIPGVANFLQTYMNMILGPVLIIVGMLLVELLQSGINGPTPGEEIKNRAERMGFIGAGFLGIVFALTFCPISAALFFGSLIPLAVQHESRFLLPAVYGIGTALPVVIFAIMIAAGAKSIGAAFNSLTKIEFWARRVTGTIFILAGIYFTLAHIFEVI